MVTAAVLHAMSEDLKVHDDIEQAPPGPGEVKVKVVASGVCHSDLSVQNGTIPLPTPMVLGHEGAGIVEEVGEGVTSLAVGDHVVLSFVPACGNCFYCKPRPGLPLREERVGDGRRPRRRHTPHDPRRPAAAPDGDVRHVRQLRDRPGDLRGEDRRRRRPALRGADRLRRPHRRRRRAEHREHPQGRQRCGRRLRRRRAQRDPGRQDRRRGEDHRRRHVRVEAQDGRAVRRHRPREGRRRRPGRRSRGPHRGAGRGRRLRGDRPRRHHRADDQHDPQRRRGDPRRRAAHGRHDEPERGVHVPLPGQDREGLLVRLEQRPHGRAEARAALQGRAS